MEEKEKIVAPEEGVSNENIATSETVDSSAVDVPESDFADEVKKPEPPKAEEPVVEEKEEAVDLYLEKEETPKTEEKQPENGDKKAEKSNKGAPSYVYDDEKLQGIENERLAFHKEYKKSNLWKWLVTVICLALIILGWVLTLIPEIKAAFDSVNASFSMYFTLILVGVSMVVLLVFSSIFKKKVDKLMKAYFQKFYELQDAYIYPASCTNVAGEINDKLDEQKLKDSGLYKDVSKIGSRACLSFDYLGHKIVISDAAAQVQDKKMLRTVFVGKFLYFANEYKGEDILIYLKGNKRALPPTNLAGRNVYKDSKTMVIYGPVTAKKVLTSPVMKAINAFDTNATFVDMAISIKEGMTYIAMGYEDDLMVLPLEKPFNPAPTKEAKKDIEQVLDLIAAFDKKD